ncbi:MAG: chloramphenicol phosphotransferase [Novosphingobium sp.]
MSGQVLIVTGTSGSGKSTACELFAKRSDDFWLLYGIDHFLSGALPAKFGHHGPRCREGIYAHPVDEADPDGPLRWSFGPRGKAAFRTLHGWVATAAREGCNIVLDHLAMTDPPVLQDLVRQLNGLPVTFVCLKPSYEVLSARIANRTMDKPMPTDLLGDDAVKKIIDRLDRLRPWFYEAVYANDIYDLVIDTEAHEPEAVVAMIEARLVEGPGTSFEALRERYPRG